MVIYVENKSIWLQEVKPFHFESLKKDLEVDILIIGGGITGVSCAYQLKDTPLKVCLVERNQIGLGVTSKTTGKLNYLQETIYTTIEENYSYEEAALYLKSQRYAIKMVKDIVQKEKIDCNFEKVSSYVFTDKEQEMQAIRKEKSILSSLGQTVETSKDIPFPLKSIYAIHVKDTAVFHPLKYVYSLVNLVRENISIYENTEIYKIKSEKSFYICNTKENQIKAKYVILACHYPFFLFPYFMPIKTYPEKSYVLASKIDEYKKNTLITSTVPTKSVRYYREKENYLIYLSNSHPSCNNVDSIHNFASIMMEAKKMDVPISYLWSNEDLITFDHLPLIGAIKENLFLATGYNTWGMTNATIASYIIKNAILGKKTEYDILFDPLRKNGKVKMKAYTGNMLKNAKGYIENKVKVSKPWYPSQLTFKTIHGKKVAIYEDGKKHMVYTKCPHMGCELIFNEIEKTWDCPCHASRFDLDGNCIKGPSLYNISYKQVKD